MDALRPALPQPTTPGPEAALRAVESARHTGASAERAEEAGRMFESLLMRMVLQQLRKTMSITGDGEGAAGGGATPGAGIYGGLMDGALADSLSSGGGIGIGDIVAAQLRSRGQTGGPSGETEPRTEPNRP